MDDGSYFQIIAFLEVLIAALHFYMQLDYGEVMQYFNNFRNKLNKLLKIFWQQGLLSNGYTRNRFPRGSDVDHIPV